jgi:hypothetical protein
MVVCNVERFLAEAIESILGQTFREFEFIIVDFGSTDRSKEIIASYAAKDSRIKLHQIPHCRLAEARNASCFLAQGEYIAIMDADDVSLPDRLMWQVDFMEKHPRVGVVCGGVELIDGAGESRTSSVVSSGVSLNRPTDNRGLQSALLTYCPFWEAVLMRREAFVQVGGYRPVFVQAEDYDLWMRVSEHFELANLEQVVFKYRLHSHQVSVRKRQQQTLCSLAVRASAAARRNDNPDPLNSVKEITPELLATLGISEEMQQVELVLEYQGWIKLMCAAGEWSSALNATIEMLKLSDWKQFESSERAETLLELARLYWKNNRFLMSTVTVGRAVIAEPRLTKRPVKLLLHRLGLV